LRIISDVLPRNQDARSPNVRVYEAYMSSCRKGWLKSFDLIDSVTILQPEDVRRYRAE